MYTHQTWANGSGGGTPISAARLQFLEDGLEDASSDWANVMEAVYAGGADPTGVADSSAAFLAAAASGKPIYVPAGTFKLTLASGSLTGSDFVMVGAGEGKTKLNPAAGKYVYDDSVQTFTVYCQGFTCDGGAGFFRSTNTGVNVGASNGRTFAHCRFWNYTKVAVCNRASDSPYWTFEDCTFLAANDTGTMGVAISGDVSGSKFINCAFLMNRCHIKLASGGMNCYISNCDFIRWSGHASGTQDIWCIPRPTWNASAAGTGFTVRSCKFGSEGLVSGDLRIVYADEGTGTNYEDRFPDLTNASTGWIVGHTIESVNQEDNGVTVPPLIRSMTPNIQALGVADVVQESTVSSILSLKTATNFDPTINAIDPPRNGGRSNWSSYTPVVADGGTLTGQPPGRAYLRNIRDPLITNYTETQEAIGNTGTAKTLDLALGTVKTATLTGNCTFTMPAAAGGKSFTLLLKTGAGSFTATFTSVRWGAIGTPVVTTAANKADLFSFMSDGSVWYGTYVQGFTP